MVNSASPVNTMQAQTQTNTGKATVNSDTFASMLAQELSANSAYMDALTKATQAITEVGGAYDGSYASILRNMSLQETVDQKKAEAQAIANVRAALAAGITKEEEPAEAEETDNGSSGLFGDKASMRDALLLLCMMMSAGAGSTSEGGLGGSGMNSGMGVMVSSLAAAMAQSKKTAQE